MKTSPSQVKMSLHFKQAQGFDNNEINDSKNHTNKKRQRTQEPV